MDIATLHTAAVEFIRLHAAWAPLIVAGLAFGESLVFMSLFTPATVLLLAVGALIATAGLSFWEIWLGAALGAVLGDWLSYEIGRRFKHTAFRLWPLSRYPELISRGQWFFQRFGTWGVFFGRFSGPARTVVPLVAGIFAMPATLFLAVNVASAFVWAFVLLAPGAGLVEVAGW